jgi:hypothetical protein
MFLSVNGSFPVSSRTETLGIGGDLEKAARFEVIGKKGRLLIRQVKPGRGWELKRPRSHRYFFWRSTK